VHNDYIKISITYYRSQSYKFSGNNQYRISRGGHGEAACGGSSGTKMVWARREARLEMAMGTRIPDGFYPI
jgi:hypothetical protein